MSSEKSPYREVGLKAEESLRGRVKRPKGCLYYFRKIKKMVKGKKWKSGWE